MIQTESIDELRQAVADWRESGDRIALVPTMGNLHRGHLELVKQARKVGDRVIVSVFVNPTQFGEGEDYKTYPRTLEIDALQLKRTSTDVLFAPEVSDVYPFGRRGATTVHVPELTSEFCGASRPGHFDGVATVVSRLYFMVQPDIAVFGQKDYQQLLVVKRMVQDLSMPIEIVSAPTVREADGLALSSRNQYLTPAERERAPELYAALRRTADAVGRGHNDFAALEARALATLEAAGFVPEYVGIRTAVSLARPQEDTEDLVILGAGRLGAARLIDNVLVTRRVAAARASE